MALAGSQLQLLECMLIHFIFTCKLCRHNILMHFSFVLLSPSSILPALSLTDVSLHGYPPHHTGYSGTQTLRSRLHHLSAVSRALSPSPPSIATWVACSSLIPDPLRLARFGWGGCCASPSFFLSHHRLLLHKFYRNDNMLQVILSNSTLLNSYWYKDKMSINFNHNW